MKTLPAARSVFSFFWFLGRKSRRTRLLAALSLLPALAALAIQIRRWTAPGLGLDGLQIFSSGMLAFYLQFLIIVLALFYGTSIVSEEVEGRTLTYLTTRPIPKPAILLGKYAAYAAWSCLLVAAGVLLSFLLLASDRLADAAAWGIAAKTLAVLCLGLLVYMALFTLAGTVLKKSVLFGLFFGFGWESVVQFFPGSTQKLTVVHYLKSLLKPEEQGPGGALSFLFIRLEPTSIAGSLLALLLVAAAALAAASSLFSRREYPFDE